MLCLTNMTCASGCRSAGCRPTCRNPNPICPDVCEIDGPSCVCAEDYVVGPNGNCINKNDCPSPSPTSCIVFLSCKNK